MLLLLVLFPGLVEAQSFSRRGYERTQDEGANLARRRTLNFIGSGVTATDDVANGRTNVTITGGGGGGGTNGLIGASSCMDITGSVSNLYMAAGTCIAQTEADVEQRVVNTVTLEDMACTTTADPGAGRTITVTGRTGPCGALSNSGTFVCTLNGGSGRPNCTTGAATLGVSGTQCWSLGVVSSGSLASNVHVNCTLERSL